MHAFVVIKTTAADSEELSAKLWEMPHVLGIEELPADGSALFKAEGEFSFAKFDPVFAERFQAWLRSEGFRSGEVLLLKVHLEAEPQPWLKELTKRCPSLEVLGHGTLDSTDYMAAVRAQFQGRNIGQSFWIGPPWQAPSADKTAIIIEPGMAFGLGDHPTTQMCLELLEQEASTRPQRILDIGTGTGVLAIAAGKLFPNAELWLTDTDSNCASNVEHNFSLNQLSHPKAFFGPDATLDKIALPKHSFALVLSNVYLEALKSLAPQVRSLLAANGRWIVSGLLGEDQLREFAATAQQFFKPPRILRREEWTALLLQ